MLNVELLHFLVDSVAEAAVFVSIFLYPKPKPYKKCGSATAIQTTSHRNSLAESCMHFENEQSTKLRMPLQKAVNRPSASVTACQEICHERFRKSYPDPVKNRPDPQHCLQVQYST
jgi:hypothetical protein